MMQNVFAGVLIALVAGVMIWFGINTRDRSDENKDPEDSEQT